MQNFIGITLM